jgi:hypothetical protein
MFTCDECGAPATVATMDTVQLPEPFVADDGTKCAMFDNGEKHQWCDSHYKPPMVTRPDGTVEVDILCLPS